MQDPRLKPDPRISDALVMKRLIPAVLLVVLACQTRPSESIEGTWKSDRAATLREIGRDPDFPPKVREKLAEILGELEVTYREGTVTTWFEGQTHSHAYEIAREGESWIEIQGCDPFDQRESLTRIWVDGDRMWVRSGPPHAEFTEYFRRVSR